MEQDSSIGNWSREELYAYVSGSMDDERMHLLESDALRDPILKEALDGLQVEDFEESLSSMDMRMSKVFSEGKVSGLSTLQKLSIAIAGVAVLGTIVYTYLKGKEIQELSQQVKEQVERTTEMEQAYEDSLVMLEIELAQNIPVEEQIIAEMAIADQVNILEESEKVFAERESAPDAMDARPPQFSASDSAASVIIPDLEIFYLNNLKLADHRDEYADERFLMGHHLGGTPARYEKEQNDIDQNQEFDQVDYQTFMDQAMSLFSSGDYKGALLRYKSMEKKHPNDLNVAFYGGLCLYNLGKWDQAQRYLKRAERHHLRVFDQEALWYYALTLRQAGDVELSRSILQSIVDKNGFYAKRARTLL